MSDVLDFTSKRMERELEQQMQREPDFELHGWLEGGEVDALYLVRSGNCSSFDHRKTVAMLVDAAWGYGAWGCEDQGRAGDPALWWILDKRGQHWFLASALLFERNRWTHLRWFCRHWLIQNIRMARFAWRVLRGRG